MGSWSELDANYPPGVLTPAAALMVALGHLAGATSIYRSAGHLATFLPPGLGYDPDLCVRAERYLSDVPIQDFLDEAVERLSPRQKLALAIRLLDRQYAAGADPERVALLIAGLGVGSAALGQHRTTLALLYDTDVFPQ